jgi:TRAP-type mannitol/chloroaromatic compound transport system permease large subunit
VLRPLLARVAQGLGFDLVWFGILVGVNLQASFMTPPLGFSLLFRRGAAPRADAIDPDSGRTVRGISTRDIYIGILPFVGVQLLVLGLLINWPGLVLRETPAPLLDAAAIERELEKAVPPADEQPRDPLELLMESLRMAR